MKFQSHVAESSLKKKGVLTFGGGMWAVRGDLSHPCSMAAEGHQSGDDGGFAEPNVSHDHDSLVHAGV